MDEVAIDRSLKRIAHEIIECNKGLENIYLVGIKTRGVPMAQRISEYLKEISGVEIKVGILDISLYRDDLSLIASRPILNDTKIDFPIDDANVIMFDDVLYTGRTVRAAIDAVFDIGRPKVLQLCVLIDRGHRELPVKADYIGSSVPTSGDEIIKVTFKESDGEDAVFIYTK